MDQFKDSIFSDGVHLVSKLGTNHLHKYCRKIKIHFCWFHKGRREHYDIPKMRRLEFFKKHPEVTKVSSKEIVRILKSIKK